MKYSIAAVACVAALVASLTACGADKSALPSRTGSPSPSTTATGAPATAEIPARLSIGTKPALENSTSTLGGLKFTVNLPADIPDASRASMRLFSDFLQAVGRTTATNKLDPAISGMASADVVKFIRSATGGESVQGVGSVNYTISTVTDAGSTTLVTGCLDQSKLLQVRKDGSQFPGGLEARNLTLKLSVSIKHGMTGPKVNSFSFTDGPC